MTKKFFHFLTAIMLVLFAMIPAIGAASSQNEQPVDLRIWTVNPAGESVYDICYTLVEYSNLGCDENQDGAVLFEDIPPGRYYVEPTMQQGGFHWTEPFTILVDELHTDHVVEAYEYRTSPDQSGPVGSQDVHIITRDPNTGDVLTDACYELVNYSNIGCDENGDGHITFADIPYGDYTIRQTTTPNGYTRMGDYDVSISGGPEFYQGPAVILLSQSQNQAPQDHRNISVVYYRPSDGMRVLNSHNCAQVLPVEGADSLVGCDEDVLDGQIDFMHVELGPNDQWFALDISLECPYGIANGSGFEREDFGDSSFTIYVQVSTEVRTDCG